MGLLRALPRKHGRLGTPSPGSAYFPSPPLPEPPARPALALRAAPIQSHTCAFAHSNSSTWTVCTVHTPHTLSLPPRSPPPLQSKTDPSSSAPYILMSLFFHDSLPLVESNLFERKHGSHFSLYSPVLKTNLTYVKCLLHVACCYQC